MKKNIRNICCVFFAASMLNVAGVHAQEKTDSIGVAFGKVAKKDILGGISSVNVPELLNKSFSQDGLFGISNFVGGYNGNIWGQAPLLLVDGVPRSASEVRASEIESVTIMKSANAVVLYGSRGANGVVLITTKRGTDKPLSIDVRANSGIYIPKRFPTYLNSADYMVYYNQAYINDGLATAQKPVYYSQALIDNTREGLNPAQYPDIDFYSSEFLKKFYNRSNVATEISGKNQFARYYSNIGMDYSNSLFNFGERKKDNNYKFNVRANVDMDITNWLTASTDVGVVITDVYNGGGDFWGQAATFRPNWFGGETAFSPLIPVNMIDPNNAALQTIVKNGPLIEGKYLPGGNSSTQTNVLADLASGAYNKLKNRTFMFNVKLAADLSSILKGLSFKTLYNIDFYDFYTESWSAGYRVYQPTWSEVDGKSMITDLTGFGTNTQSLNESVGNTSLTKTMTSSTQFNYNRSFGAHNLSLSLLGWGYQIQNSVGDAANDANLGSIHRNTNVNLGFEANYNFRNKYYLDFSAAEVHSSKLPLKNRNAFSPAVSVGWRLSDEEFFKNHFSFVNNFKLNASYANLHQDIDITDGTNEYYLYKGYFKPDGNWFDYRDRTAGGWAAISGRGSNPDLDFVQKEELRAGLEASLWNNFVELDANYFIQNTKGLLTNGLNQTYPSYFGNSFGSVFTPWLNYNNDQRTGLDFSLKLNKKIGAVECSLGFVGMFYSSEAKVRDEYYQDNYQNRAGKPLDAYWGYIAEGFFTDNTDISTHADQKPLGEQKPGDIKYKDVNNDGVVDSKDQVNLGHNGWAVSPFTYGINFTMKWKNLTLFAMGSGQDGAIGFKNSTYYWIKGTGKYSEVVRGQWTEATQNSATYPRLTTKDNNNNYQNSTFWMYKTSRFDLTRVQITYDLPANLFKNSFVHALSVYLSSDNLLTISKERKLMEMNIGSAPQFRFFNLGAKASF